MANWTEEQLREHMARASGESVAAAPKPAPQPKPRMNKWETAFAQHLEGERLAGLILAWHFEGIKLRLAAATFYTPDFSVIRLDGRLGFVEVKGHWRDDARVKFKVAAEMFPRFEFVAVAKEGAGWRVIDRRNAREASAA